MSCLFSKVGKNLCPTFLSRIEVKLHVHMHFVYSYLHNYNYADGEWVGCEKVYVKHQDDKDFMKLNDFLVDGAAPTTLVVRLDIKITGTVCVL